MFCPNCGSQNPEEAKFCGKCGKTIALVNEPINDVINEVSREPKRKSFFFRLLITIGKNKKLLIAFGVIIIIAIPAGLLINERSSDGGSNYNFDNVKTPSYAGGSNYGTRLEFNNSELFYTSNVSYKEAEQLGNELVGSGFFSGKLISAQLDKSGKTYQFKYVVKTGYENKAEYLNIVAEMANEISNNAFKGAPVEIHLTDPYFKTLKIINQNQLTKDNDFGRVLYFNGGELYYTNSVTRMQAQKLGILLTDEGFYDGTLKTAQINKNGKVYQFRMVVKDGLDNNDMVIDNAKLTADYLSKKAFSNSPVEVHLCDSFLRTLRIIKNSGSSREYYTD